MLEELFTQYGTDKGIWGYTPHYEKLMRPSRYSVRRVLEIGICGYRDIPNNVVGASLFAWRDYFPNAEIYGIDYDGRFIFNDQDRIHTAQCDAYDPVALEAAIASFGGGNFDMIVDDAVHDPLPQIQLMNQLYKHLTDSGRYFMEDVCPYKMPRNDMRLGMMDHIHAPYSVVGFEVTHKPEVLVIGVR